MLEWRIPFSAEGRLPLAHLVDTTKPLSQRLCSKKMFINTQLAIIPTSHLRCCPKCRALSKMDTIYDS